MKTLDVIATHPPSGRYYKMGITSRTDGFDIRALTMLLRELKNAWDKEGVSHVEVTFEEVTTPAEG